MTISGMVSRNSVNKFARSHTSLDLVSRSVRVCSHCLESALPTKLQPLLWDPYLNGQRIAGLARDNRIPHSGLRAYMWMRAIASLR